MKCKIRFLRQLFHGFLPFPDLCGTPIRSDQQAGKLVLSKNGTGCAKVLVQGMLSKNIKIAGFGV